MPEIAAVVAGGAAGGATANPAIGFGVGVATAAGATAAVQYYGRSQQNAEQNAIARVAGDLSVGGTADWKIEHFLPFNDEHGQLRVSRVVSSPLAECKEVVFSVDSGNKKSPKLNWYITNVCKTAESWKWAAAEPAVERWGYLQ